MKKTAVLLCCALLLAALCPGGAGFASAAGPEPAAAERTVTDESAEEILALAEIPGLRRVDAAESAEYDALLRLRELLPDCEVRWEVELQGERYPSDTEELKLSGLDGLEDALRYLPALTKVDLLDAGASQEDLERFRAIRPDVFFLWQFKIDGRTVRTDTRIYSSLRGIESPWRDIDYYYPVVAYCPYLKALDLGHNGITDVTLIGELKDLQVLILADNKLTDLSPLGNLTELVYLELFLNDGVEDFSFLNRLTKIKDLNLCYCRQLDSLDFMEYMPDLRFLMVKRTSVPREEFDAWKERRPEVKMVLSDVDPESTGNGWRYTGRNRMIRTAFSEWWNIPRYDGYNDYDLRINGGVHPITDFYSEDD